MEDKNKRFMQRRKRVRARVSGKADRPRLSVFRSNKKTYAQIINDEKGITLVSVSDGDKEVKGKTKTDRAFLLGEILAKKALVKKIKRVVFDRAGYKYHGRVKALAEGARKGGLEF